MERIANIPEYPCSDPKPHSQSHQVEQEPARRRGTREGVARVEEESKSNREHKSDMYARSTFSAQSPDQLTCGYAPMMAGYAHSYLHGRGPR